MTGDSLNFWEAAHDGPQALRGKLFQNCLLMVNIYKIRFSLSFASSVSGDTRWTMRGDDKNNKDNIDNENHNEDNHNLDNYKEDNDSKDNNNEDNNNEDNENGDNDNNDKRHLNARVDKRSKA